MNAITYSDVSPHLQRNEMWLGYKSLNLDMYFNVTDDYKQWLLQNKKEGSAYKIINGVVMGRLASACWFTNIDHGRRHEELLLDTMEHNLKYNKKLRKKFETEYGKIEYPRYDNYDAIEVPFTECIPSDYIPCWFNCPAVKDCEYAKQLGMNPDTDGCCDKCSGIMGVPITFMDKYNPEQFEIIGNSQRGCHDENLELKKYDDYWEMRQDGTRTGSSGGKTNGNPNIANNDGVHNYFINSEGHIVQSCYNRVFICRKRA